MITEHDLQEAIAECEGQKNPTSNTCIKLAAFYTIREHLFPSVVTTPSHSFASTPVAKAYTSNTEFGKLVSNLDQNKVISVIDELMTALSVINPRLYNKTMDKIEELNYSH